jgi:hypothetical protein
MIMISMGHSAGIGGLRDVAALREVEDAFA